MEDRDCGMELISIIRSTKDPEAATKIGFDCLRQFLEALGIPTNEEEKEVK